MIETSIPSSEESQDRWDPLQAKDPEGVVERGHCHVHSRVRGWILPAGGPPPARDSDDAGVVTWTTDPICAGRLNGPSTHGWRGWEGAAADEVVQVHRLIWRSSLRSVTRGAKTEMRGRTRGRTMVNGQRRIVRRLDHGRAPPPWRAHSAATRRATSRAPCSAAWGSAPENEQPPSPAHDQATARCDPALCHPERSEGVKARLRLLRFAQDDIHGIADLL